MQRVDPIERHEHVEAIEHDGPGHDDGRESRKGPPGVAGGSRGFRGPADSRSAAPHDPGGQVPGEQHGREACRNGQDGRSLQAPVQDSRRDDQGPEGETEGSPHAEETHGRGLLLPRDLIHEPGPLRVKRCHADPTHHDRREDPGVTGSDSRDGEPRPRKEDPGRHQPGGRNAIGQMPEHRLNHRGGDIAGKDDESRGRVGEVVLRNQKRQQGRERALIDVGD